MDDKQIIDEFRYADGTTEEENYKSFINLFDTDDEVYYRGKHYIEFMETKFKRKEQECEELDNEAQNLFTEKTNLEFEVKDLRQQLDQLKAKNSILEDEYKILEDNLDSRTRDFEDVIDGYKQTLTEIKEIATNFYETGFLRTGDDCILINNHLCVETLDKILQKISEVEDDMENN